MALEVYLVRHGETQSNLDRVFQGHLDTSLTERGKEQAECVARTLERIRFDAIYSSDLARAADTARVIASRQNSTDVVLNPGLREMHYGVLQGVPLNDAARVLEPYGIASHWESGVFSARGLAAPGGESVRQVRNRASRFIAQVDAEHAPVDGQRILVVSHGGFLRVLVTVFLGLPASQRNAFAIDNCSITKLMREGGKTRLEFHNHVCWRDQLHQEQHAVE